MSNVAIVTDSTCSLPQDLIEKYNIYVAPQIVIWGNESMLDGVDITAEAFYERLVSSQDFPTTSQATIANFKQIFETVHAEGRPMVAVCVSHKLSGTMQSAQQAKDMLPEAEIELVDSATVAMALGFQVLAAARAAERGASPSEIVAEVKAMMDNTGVVLMLDTLEFLHRGGRIGAAQRLLGTALNMKPLLEIQDGAVAPLDRVRTKSKASDRLMEILEERLEGRSGVRMAVHHTGEEAIANQMMDRVRDRFKPEELLFSIITPAVGAHAGPGAVAIAYAYDS